MIHDLKFTTEKIEQNDELMRVKRVHYHSYNRSSSIASLSDYT